MADLPNTRLRCNRGKFTTKRKEEWKNNVRIAAKRRKKEMPLPEELSVDGRRIVELKQMASDMWCKMCDQPLSLRFIEEEVRYSLASILIIRCHNCLARFEVNTCKKNVQVKDGTPKYDVNVKAALALIDSGIGSTHFNTLLSAINVPTVHHNTMKRHEQIVGPAIEAVATRSCQESIRLEKELTLQKYGLDAVTADGKTKIKVGIDTGWQTRGNGRSFDSLSGHTSLIAVESGRAVARAVRIKICALCSAGRDPSDHKCRKNFSGSAKAMEPDMAAEVVAHNKDLEAENVIVGTIVGDEDASTMCRIRREVSHTIDKESDLNHITKSLSNKLWSNGKLPKSVIEYLKKCFSCAIKKNRGNPDAVKDAISNVVDHAFDKHEKCGEWCRYNDDPDSYKHAGLPQGKGLSGEQLYNDLKNIFTMYANNAQKIAACSSTQPNESFNAMVMSKAPKSRCYGRSESLVYRVDSAVSQKNLGTSYILAVNKELQMSPGKNTYKFRQKKDAIRKKIIDRSKTVEFKRRRLTRKTLRSQKRANIENREGITYSTGCSLADDISVPEEVPIASATDMAAVVFDLETTGFGPNAEVVQIAAKYRNLEFTCYILPSHGIPAVVTGVTGLSIQDGALILQTENGSSCISTTPPRIACVNFISFLKTISSNVILVAHKGVTFDGPHIVKQMDKEKLLDEFGSVVKGFTDTLPVFKHVKELASRVATKGSFKQSDLAHDYLGPDSVVGAHNASVDVRVLQNLLNRFSIEEAELIRRAIPFFTVVNAPHEKRRKKARADELNVIQGQVSKCMILKIAAAGITLEQLESAYSNHSESGVSMLLGADIGGKPRVTKNKKSLTQICNALQKRLQ